MKSRHLHAGFSLLEVLIVVAIMGILAALVLPSSEPSLNDQLRGAAQVLKTDLAYAQSLAISNNSTYEVTFDFQNNSYTIQHSGSNPALDTLPHSPFSNPDDPPEAHIVRLADMPHIGPPVKLVTAVNFENFATPVDKVEFGPLGETTQPGYTLIWLSAGNGTDTRYLWFVINPITGLVEMQYDTTSAPPASLMPATKTPAAPVAP